MIVNTVVYLKKLEGKGYDITLKASYIDFLKV